MLLIFLSVLHTVFYFDFHLLLDFFFVISVYSPRQELRSVCNEIARPKVKANQETSERSLDMQELEKHSWTDKVNANSYSVVEMRK